MAEETFNPRCNQSSGTHTLGRRKSAAQVAARESSEYFTLRDALVEGGLTQLVDPPVVDEREPRKVTRGGVVFDVRG